MESYLLTIFVTLEQEIAIRQIFISKGWSFKKYEDFTVDSSSNPGQSLYPSPMVQPDWTQTCRDNFVDVDNNNLFEYQEKQPHHMFSASEQTMESYDKATYMTATQSNTSNNATMENEVITKLAEIMEDSMKNVQDKAVMNEDTNDDVEDLFPEGEIEEETMDSDKSVSVKTDHNVYSNEVEAHCSHLKEENVEKRKKTDEKCPLKSKQIHVDRDTSGEAKAIDMPQMNKKFVKSQKKQKKTKVAKVKRSSLRDISVAEEMKDVISDKKIGSFHCADCNYTFKLLGSYKNHKKDGKCVFECEYCGKKFTSRYYSNYQSHLKYHLKDRHYQCVLCDKSYIDAQALKIHVRKHTGDRPFICDICGKSFYSSSHLLYHKNSNHQESKNFFKCDLCDAFLSTMGNLRVHQKVVHTNERPFTCEICGKTFKTQKSLEQVHAKVHKDVYPYKCNFTGCDKVFKRAEGLSDHIRRHNNQRTHFCERCGKGFYSNKDLQLHARTHSGEKPYSCQLCEYKSALAGNLRKHMRTHQ